MKKRGLKKILTLSFLGVSAVAVLISSSINIYSNFLSTKKVVAKQQQIIADDAVNQVKSFIQQKTVMLTSIGNVNNIAAENQEKQILLLGKLLGLDTAFRQMALLDMQNNELARVSRLTKSIKGQLTDEHKKDALSQMASVQEYISPVYVDDVTFEPIIIMAVPIKNATGDKSGYIMAEVNLKFMWDMMDSMKIGKKGLAYVTDRKGNLIAFGDEGRVIKGEKVAGLKVVTDFIKTGKMPVNENVITAKGIKGSSVVSSYVTLTNPDWAVFIELPIMEAYQPVIKNILSALLAVMISFAIAVLIGAFLSKKITKPIIDLKNAARLISKGELDTVINVNSRTEIGELADDFNRMVSNINTLVTNIKQTTRIILEQSSVLKDRSNYSAQSAQAVVCSMEQISVGADEQAHEAGRTTEQTGILGEEIDHAVAKAVEVEKVTGFTRSISLKSKDTVKLLIDRAKETDKITKTLLENTGKLNNSLGKIKGIADAISEITSKTKTLSLNARVEAARAGEAGLGFVVIVNEISNLANQSRDAAKLIEPILKEIQLQTDDSVRTSEKANEIIEEQMQAVYSTQGAFDEIILSMDNAIGGIVDMNKIIKNIENFKEASINSVMTISSITEQTAASCQEVTAASQEQKAIADEVREFANNLYDMGEKLVETIDVFKTREA